MIVELAAARRVERGILRRKAAHLGRRLTKLGLARLRRLEPGRFVLAACQAVGQALQQAHRPTVVMILRMMCLGGDLGLHDRREILDPRHALRRSGDRLGLAAHRLLRRRLGSHRLRLGRRLLVWADHIAGTLGTARLDAAARDDARGMLAAGRTGALSYGYDGQRRGDELTLFVSSFAPAPRMIVFGAIDFAAAVARIGAFLGYRVTVCDARPVFATARRFPDAHEVVVEWPHRYLHAQAVTGALDARTVVCVLTHDPKFDGPLLEVALRLPLAYVGAMGSRRTHAERLDRLRAAGLAEADLARLCAPVGLDLGARTPEETAVSIAAEIIAHRWGGTGERLSLLNGQIHHGGGG